MNPIQFTNQIFSVRVGVAIMNQGIFDNMVCFPLCIWLKNTQKKITAIYLRTEEIKQRKNLDLCAGQGRRYMYGDLLLA